MIPLDPPRYPVINATPLIGDAVKSFKLSEYATVGAVTVGSGIFGYAIGASTPPSLFLLVAVGRVCGHIPARGLRSGEGSGRSGEIVSFFVCNMHPRLVLAAFQRPDYCVPLRCPA